MEPRSPEQARFLNYYPEKAKTFARNLNPLTNCRPYRQPAPEPGKISESEERRLLLEILKATRVHLEYRNDGSEDATLLHAHNEERREAMDFMFSGDGRLEWLCGVCNLDYDFTVDRGRIWAARGAFS